MILAWLGDHWLLASVAALVVAVAVFAPALGLAVLRFLLGTEAGRYLLLAAIVIGAGVYAWEARFSAGYAAAVAEQARAAEGAHAAAQDQAVKRDDTSDTATDKAEASAEARQADRNERTARVEGIAREPRPAVPAVCPEPDPRLVQELAGGAARLRAAQGRLRSIDAPEG